MLLSLFIALVNCAFVWSSLDGCRFAPNFQCRDFKSKEVVQKYLSHVMKWEGSGFAQPGIGYDPKSGYSYDGHPLNYKDGSLYGEPHLFSAPSKESIHLGVLALAIEGNENALIFTGGFQAAIDVLALKMRGYMAFNATYPGYGCFHPWVDFDLEKGTFNPIESWSKPYYKVPGLDNGEMFWSVYAVTLALEKHPEHADLAKQYRAFMQCQRDNAKTIFYRGNGDVSAVVYILDGSAAPTPENYIQSDGYLNDPYEGETLTQLMYLFSDWDTAAEREYLWEKKHGLFTASNYTIPPEFIQKGHPDVVTVQTGFWFSTHEQWKLLLLPYLSRDLPLVHRVFSNAEKVRAMDAIHTAQPGLLASINDVTDGSQNIPDYISAAGIPGISFQEIERRDVLTPYGSFAMMLFDLPQGLCWYNNMLSAPRMQSRYGSTEAINVNGTEISPLTTWDSKITTVLGMLGGVGHLVAEGLRSESDPLFAKKLVQRDQDAYARFVSVVSREHSRVFGEGTGFVSGDHLPYLTPQHKVPTTELSDWEAPCGTK